ncbi:MAG: hypothetical protein ACPGID_09240 [Rubricella sp.]
MKRNGANTTLSFIAGALAVAVIGMGAYIYTDGFGEEDASVTIELPQIQAEG